MKSVLILSNKKDWRDKQPFRTAKFYSCYEFFHDLARERQLEVFSASYNWYESNKKIFKFGWRYKNGRWKKIRNIRPDIIYDKTSFSQESDIARKTINQDFRIINDPEFTVLAGHKLFASLLLPKYFKSYFIIKYHTDLHSVLEKIPSKKIVIKPPMECGGKDIQIIDKDRSIPDFQRFPVLAQEFVDSSSGIKGIVGGMHDLRLVFVNNRLIYSFVRQPAENSFLANLAKGGTMFYVNNKNLPKSLFPIINDVQRIFSCFNPKIYSVDFMFDRKQRPCIVEFNTMPGFFFFSPNHKRKQKKLFLAIINLLKKEIGNNS